MVDGIYNTAQLTDNAKDHYYDVYSNVVDSGERHKNMNALIKAIKAHNPIGYELDKDFLE